MRKILLPVHRLTRATNLELEASGRFKHHNRAFMDAEELAQQVTGTELDPVSAVLVRKAFRLLDSMSSMVGEIGPRQMEYFAHHFGKLPNELQAHDEDSNGLWSIEEFSQLCVGLIRLHGDDKFRMLVEGLFESYAHKTKLHTVFWEGWALWVDWVSLVFLTLSYSLVLAVLFNCVGDMPGPGMAEIPDYVGGRSGRIF